MGFVAYKADRSTGGSINVIFPSLENQIEVPDGYLDMSDILAMGFPVETPVITCTANIEALRNFGFASFLNWDDYAGETWTFENGYTFVFGMLGDIRELFIYDPDNVIYSNVPISVNESEVRVDWLPCKVGEREGTPVSGFIPLSGLHQGKMSFIGSAELTPGTLIDLAFFEGLTPIIDTSDPYEQGGESATGGGTGTFSGTGDAIAIPSLPTLSAVDAGFITLFNPSITQLGSLASYMWSDLFDIDGWRKIFADPMNAILGLSIVPVNVPSGNVKTVKVGNISTGVSMTVASSQYVEVDCGTLNVQEFWGAYLDYDPYTKAEIYLPYIGTHALAVDDIMNKSVHVVYHVDVLSGACCAYVQCGGTVLYTFIGQCSSSIPITGDNWTNVINGAISIAGSIGSMVATGGVSAPMEIGNIASTAVNTMKPSVEKSGAMGGTGGMMGVQTPYLILTRPRQALPARQNSFTGYPSFITEQLSTLSGYTEVFKIHLENVPATEQELAEIETLLKSGVIF